MQNFILFNGRIEFHSSLQNMLPHIKNLDCFGILAIVNSDAMNIGMHITFLIKAFIFLVICSGMDLLDHIVTLFSVL